MVLCEHGAKSWKDERERKGIVEHPVSVCACARGIGRHTIVSVLFALNSENLGPNPAGRPCLGGRTTVNRENQHNKHRACVHSQASLVPCVLASIRSLAAKKENMP